MTAMRRVGVDPLPVDCPPGQARWQWFSLAGYPSSAAHRQRRVEYNYRAPDGALFTYVAKTLSDARAARERWLAHRGKVATP